MHDFSQWLQSAGGMDEKGVRVPCLRSAFLRDRRFYKWICYFSFSVRGRMPLPVRGIVLSNLESEIKQIWGLQEVSSECDLPDHELPTKNMKCYVTNGKGHKELVEIRVSKDGTKLGLYDTDGKALKTTGKE